MPSEQRAVSEAAYQSFSEWLALNTPSLQEDEVLEQAWSAITTVEFKYCSIEPRGSDNVDKFVFKDFATSRFEDGTLSFVQGVQKASFHRVFGLQAYVSASIPIQNFFEVSIQATYSSGRDIRDEMTVAFQSRNGMFRISGILSSFDIAKLQKESLEVSLTNYVNGTVDKYAMKHCDCFNEWICSLTDIVISERLLFSARKAMKEGEQVTNDTLCMDLTNLVIAGHGTNRSLVHAMKRRHQDLQRQGQLVSSKRMANMVSIIVPSSSGQQVVASINLRSGKIQANEAAQEVWSLSLDASFILEDLFRLEVCLAGFPITMMKSQRERRLHVDDKGVASIECDEGLCLIFSLVKTSTIRASAGAKEHVSDVARVMEPWLSGTTQTASAPEYSEYMVRFKSVSFPFETVRSKLETLGIYEL